jgi:serine/threonine protein kinase
MSPEQLSKTNYNHKVDIYSLGLILVDLLIPSTTEAERSKVLGDAKAGEYPKFLDKEWLELLSTMLHAKPDMRPEAAHILHEGPRTHLLRRSRSRSR